MSLEFPSCLSLLSPPVVLSSGCPVVDNFLKGGFRTGITEIVGESAVGKTQLAMQLLLQVQLPVADGGLDGYGLYLCTESKLSDVRLVQMMKAFKQRHEWTKEYEFRDAIFIESIKDFQDSTDVFYQRLPRYLEARSNVRLLIIDSIGSLLRTEFNNSAEQLKERSSYLFTLSAHLKQLSERFKMPIIVVNQVSDFIYGVDDDYSKFNRSQCRISSGTWKIPTLGISWAHCVNVRIFLTRNNNNEGAVERSMFVMFSPMHSNLKSINYSISQDGFFGIE